MEPEQPNQDGNLEIPKRIDPIGDAINNGHYLKGLKMFNRASEQGMPDDNPAKAVFASDTPLSDSMVRTRAEHSLHTEALAKVLEIHDVIKDDVLLGQQDIVIGWIIEYLRTTIEPQRWGTIDEILNKIKRNIEFMKSKSNK